MKSITLLTVLYVILLSSCKRTYDIPKEDFKLMPYSGNEVLVFNSTKGDVDTIFLQGKKTEHFLTDVWSIPNKDIETCYVIAKHSDPSPPDGKQRYLDSSRLVSLLNDGETKLRFDFSAKNAWFYGDKDYFTDSLTRAKPTRMNIKGRLYTDVVVLKPNWRIYDRKDTTNIERPNTVTILYWSISNGVVRFDKIDGECWELIKKYVP